MSTSKYSAKIVGYQLGLISFIRLSTILRLSPNFIYIHPKYFLRGLFIFFASLLAAPFQLLEWVLFRKKIAEVTIDSPPIFIIGHWRSGTTHLHNLMALDPRFGYLSMYQSIVPDCSLVFGTWMKRLLNRILPQQRPMDSMEWNMDTPQEEEVALCRMMPYSFYTQFIFPHKAVELFDKGVLLERAPSKIKEEIKCKYMKLLKIVTMACQGKQLVLKNPVNTARIALLLELFPDAKFIHIHRSPIEVFVSTCNLHNRLFSITTLQNIRDRTPEDVVFVLYRKLMAQFFKDRDLIPGGNIIDVRYSDLDSYPVETLGAVYSQLNIEEFDSVKPIVEQYIESQRAYKKNTFEIDENVKDKVMAEWGDLSKKLGYRY